MNKYIFTCGDTNGIGPEIVIKTINSVYQDMRGKIFFACPSNIFSEASSLTLPAFRFEITSPGRYSHSEDIVSVIDTGKTKFTPGEPTKFSGKAAVKAIKTAYMFAGTKKADALITAPISKTAIHMAGFKYPGHTEMLAEWSSTRNFVMMFLSEDINAALVTIHEPINKVPSLITRKRLDAVLTVVINTLKNDLGIKNPKAAVLGLNPHAGEDGLIGKEEEKIIKPFIKTSAFAEHMEGPFSPDAFFGNKLYKNYDVVIGMYHDQVLIPFKLMNFSAGVNYTAGLPVIRTSPDHGTAFNIAYRNSADYSSMYHAFSYAEKITAHRKLLIL